MTTLHRWGNHVASNSNGVSHHEVVHQIHWDWRMAKHIAYWRMMMVVSNLVSSTYPIPCQKSKLYWPRLLSGKKLTMNEWMNIQIVMSSHRFSKILMVLFSWSTNFTIQRHSCYKRDGGGLTNLFEINSLLPKVNIVNMSHKDKFH